MNQSVLEFIIKATDQASSVISGISSSLQNLQPAFQAMAVVGTAAFASLSAVAYTSIDAAAKQQDANVQLAAAFNSSGRAAIDVRQQLENVSTISKTVATNMETAIVPFKNISNSVFPQVMQAAADMAARLGTDPVAAASLLGKALEDPVQGLGKLRAAQIVLSDVQKQSVKDFEAQGNIAAAQGVILSALSEKYGGAAAASLATFDGHMAQLTNTITDAKIALGNTFLPMLNQLIDTVRPVVTSIQGWIEKNPELARNILLAGLAVSGFVAALGILGLALTPILAGVAALISPFGLVVAVIAALIGVAVLFYGRWTEIMTYIDQKTGLITFFKDQWNALVLVFQQALMPALQRLWDSLTPLLPFLKIIGEVIGVALVVAVGLLVAAVVGITEDLALLVTGFADLESWILNKITPTLNSFGSTVQTVAGYVMNLVNAVGKISGGALSSIGSALSGAVGAVGNVIGVHDAIISPNGNVITTDPADYLIATKNPAGLSGGAGTIQININGAIFSQDAANQLGTMIMQRLKRVSNISLQ